MSLEKVGCTVWCGTPNEIENFIERFRRGHNEGALLDCFLYGNCYHFAVILKEVFRDRLGGNIVYDPIEGHFYYELYARYYDIRGRVVPENKPLPLWYIQFHDKLLYERLLRDCVYKFDIKE